MNTVTIELSLYDKLKESYDAMVNIDKDDTVCIDTGSGFIIMKNKGGAVEYVSELNKILSENNRLLRKKVEDLETELFRNKFRKRWF